MADQIEQEHADDVGPAALPSALRQDWPAPWKPVWGDKRGPWRTVLSRCTEALIAIAVRLPEPVLHGALAGLARILRRVLPERTRVAKAFLLQAFPDLDDDEVEARVLQSWRHFMRIAVDAERFLRFVPESEIRSHFEVEWDPAAKQVRDQGVGCVIVTAHIGNWEVSPLIAPWIGFDPFYAVAKPIRNRPFSKVVQRSRERRGIRLLPRRGAMRDAPRVLEAGGAIGMLLDQRARKKPVLAPFFGRPARCDRSAGVLMKRLGAPVLLVACYQTDRPLYFKAHFSGCILPEEVRGATPEEISGRINAAFEDMIRAAPDQYFWLHDRYKDTPLETAHEDGSQDGPEGGTATLSREGSSVVE